MVISGIFFANWYVPATPISMAPEAMAPTTWVST